MTPALHQHDLQTIALLIAQGEVTSRQVVEACLDRIAALQPRLNAFITVFHDKALAAATRADTARRHNAPLGRLHGVPIGIKDIFEIEGEVMTAGMPSRRGRICRDTATVVRRLTDAGAIIVGTQNVAEGVFGEYLPPYGPPVNPRDPGLWSGASSGGSAVAVAAGLGYGAIGSDTGGSIRMPSAVNGTTGLKPTWGRVSRHGVFELAGTLDHVGPIARTAADAALLFDVIAGPDPRDRTTLATPAPALTEVLGAGVAGLTVGVDPGWIGDGVAPEVSAAVQAVLTTLEQAGAVLRRITLPSIPDVVDVWYDVCADRVAEVHAESFARHAETYSQALSAIIRHGQAMTTEQRDAGRVRRAAYSAALVSALESVDLVAIPVLPFPPPTLARTRSMDRGLIDALHRFTCPFTLSGAPAITFPGGTSKDGLPLAVQLVARLRAEDVLIRAAHAFQSATAFDARPVEPRNGA